MAKLSAKRQITIPISQCRALGIEAGDEVESFVVNGQLTLVKKVAGAARGLLGHIEPLAQMTDEESLKSTFD